MGDGGGLGWARHVFFWELKPVGLGMGQIVAGSQAMAMAMGLLFLLLLGVAQPITWLRVRSRLLTSADTGRGSSSQPDTSWQPHLHKSLIV